MRSFVALAACTGALLGVACTNDYDALLAGASEGGGSAASTAEAGSTSADGSSASTTTIASTADAASSSGAGGEGGGPGGTGGSGGAAGTGGAPPEVRPCEGFRVDFEDTTLPDDWDDDAFGADLSYGGGTMRVAFDGDTEKEGGLAFREVVLDDLRDCAVTTAVDAIEPIPENAEAGGLLAMFDGPVGDEDAPLAGIAVAVTHLSEEPPQTFVGVLKRTEGVVEYVARAPVDGDLPVRIRMRHEGTTHFFEAELGGDWVEVAAIAEDDIEGEVDRVGVGAMVAYVKPGDGSTVTVGPINTDP